MIITITNTGSPAKFCRATILTKRKDNLRIFFGKFLSKIKFPAILREFKYEDLITGQTIEIKPHILYTIITINSRDYYFYRINGKFDGTGYNCKCN